MIAAVAPRSTEPPDALFDELGSADWQARVAASKFAAWPAYGTLRRGHIGLQDHGHRVAFRNIRIRELQASGDGGAR